MRGYGENAGDLRGHGLHGFETRSLPNSLAATRRGFTFYLADPVSSIHGFLGWGGEEQGERRDCYCLRGSAILASDEIQRVGSIPRTGGLPLSEGEGFDSLLRESWGHPHLIRVDFHGANEVPTGTCHAILKAAGLKRK